MRHLLAALAVVIALTAVAQAQGKAPAVEGAVRIKRPQVVGVMDRTIVERVLRRHLGQLQACYQRSRRQAPRLKGTLVATFRIQRVGTTAAVRVEGVDNALENCAANLVRRLRFPSGPGENDVRVELVLRPPPPPPKLPPASVLDALGSGCVLGTSCPCLCPCPQIGGGLQGAPCVGR